MSVIADCRQMQGFTLIELLIAMSLTVLIGAISYRFLDAAIRVQEQGDAAQQSLTALEQTWQMLASDLQNSIDRPVVKPATGADFLAGLGPVIEGESRRPSLLSAQFFDSSLAQLVSRDGALLWFSRQGWVNPLAQQRSEIQRILYRLDDNGNLYRDYWPERNQDMSAAPEGSLLLLENVRSVQFGFLASGQHPDNSAWLTQWPPSVGFPQQTEAGEQVSRVPQRYMPAAVRVTLEFLGTDESNPAPTIGNNANTVIQRIFLLAGL